MGASSRVFAVAVMAACVAVAGCAVDDRRSAETRTARAATSTTAAPFREFNQDGTYHICSGMMCDFPAGTYETAGPSGGPFCVWVIRTNRELGAQGFVGNGSVDTAARVTLRDGQYFTTMHCQTWQYLG